jgi:hypothetical protein
MVHAVHAVQSLLCGLAVLVALGGCAPDRTAKTGSQAATGMSSNPSDSRGTAAATAELVLADFKLVDPLKRPMEVTAKGAVTLPNGLWGNVSVDGVVLDPQGAVRARVAGGRVLDAAGNEFASLSPEGIAKVQGKELGFDGEGRLDLGKGNVILLEPANSPARRTATLIVLVALLRPAQADIHLTPKVKLAVPIVENPPK